MLKTIKIQGSLILDLTINDFKTKYADAVLGYGWAFIQPLITIFVYWIVFQYGLRVGNSRDGVPYLLWFMAGMMPWLFFAESLGTGMNCFREYNYLVKKVVFPINVLPIVKVMASFFVHLIFLVLFSCFKTGYRLPSHIQGLTLLYYLFCLLIYTYTLVLLSSCLLVFFKGMGQLIQVLLQAGMWATPILWDYEIVPLTYRWVLNLNPMFYAVKGYRKALLGLNVTTRIYEHALFFCIVGLLFLFAVAMFKRLRPHFADVL